MLIKDISLFKIVVKEKFLFVMDCCRLGMNLVQFGGSFVFFRFGRFEVRFLGPKRRFVRFEVRFKGSTNLPNLFKPGKLPDIDTIFSKFERKNFKGWFF